MIDCPNCHSPMTPQTAQVFGAIPHPVEVDSCQHCNLFWFDRSENAALTPDAVLGLFQLVGQAGAPDRSLSSAPACPRCRHSLAFTHDLQRNVRFTYWRCANGDGQLITFGQFLAEKNLIRPPSAGELAKLKATVRQVSCSQCGAPINLQTDSACTHCGAAVMLIDPDGIAKALHELKSGADERPSNEQAAAKVVLSDAQINALFDAQRVQDDGGHGDLLAIGAAAIGAVLSGLLAAR
jgi:hypothetical protein